MSTLTRCAFFIFKLFINKVFNRMANKKIIITQEQLRKLDEVRVQLQSTDNTPSGYANTLKNSQSQINAAQGATNSDVEAVISGPKQREDLPPMVTTVQQGEDPAQAVQKQNADYIGQGGSVVVNGPGFGGNKMYENIYTKKQIEEARLRSMEDKSDCFTKKQISEMTENLTSDALSQMKEKIRSTVSFCVYHVRQSTDEYEREYEIKMNALDQAIEGMQETLNRYGIQIVNSKFEDYGDGEFEIDYFINWIPQQNFESEEENEIYDELNNLGNREIQSFFYEDKGCISFTCNLGVLRLAGEE